MNRQSVWSLVKAGYWGLVMAVALNSGTFDGSRLAPTQEDPVPAPTMAAVSTALQGVPADLAQILEEAAQQYEIDVRLLVAVARKESDFRRNAVSPVGARGVMQLMPATAAWLGVRDAFDPRQNIFGGARYLKMLHKRFDGNLDLMLAAYNAGPGSVRKHRGIPPYRETRAYVAAIRNDFESSLRRQAPKDPAARPFSFR